MEKKQAKKNAGGGRLPKIAFVLAIIVGYFLVPQIVMKEYLVLSLGFLLTFAMSMACLSCALAEKFHAVKGKLVFGNGNFVEDATATFSLIASLLGFVALEACGMAFSCSAAGIGILSIVVPGFAMHYVSEFAVYVVAISIAVQLGGMLSMGCFRKGVFGRCI